jgi:uncharacterized protein (UPF0305 family)
MTTLICNGFENQFKTVMNPAMVLNSFLRTDVRFLKPLLNRSKLQSWFKVVIDSLKSVF